MSITHRLTGIGLTLGMLLLTWWVAAAGLRPARLRHRHRLPRLLVRAAHPIRLLARAVLPSLQRHPPSRMGCGRWLREGADRARQRPGARRRGGADGAHLVSGVELRGDRHDRQSNATSLRSPLGRARGLARRKRACTTVAQRVTAVALIPLTSGSWSHSCAWPRAGPISISGSPRRSTRAADPVHRGRLIFTAALGMQVVLEDYVEPTACASFPSCW